jgi:polyisoprenoid-binding protein YceI
LKIKISGGKMNSRFKNLLLLFIPFIFSTVHAANQYELDTAHTRFGFAVKHMLITTVKGNFKEFSGSIEFDENDITKTQVSITIMTQSIDTDNERRDNHLRSDDFFDAEKFPKITFVSKKIEKEAEGYSVIGDLTMRDVTKEVRIPFQVAGPIDGRRGSKRIGIDGAFTLNRQNYGVSYSRTLDNGGLVVSNDVKIEINIEAIFQPEE